jgi:hypothetical protein
MELDVPRIEHDSTVELSVNMKTSALSRFPDLASSSSDSTMFVNSLQFDDWVLSSDPQTPILKENPKSHEKVAPKPVPDASPNP